MHGNSADPQPASSSADLDTRRRLLHAAAEVFAEHGYRAATVREICAKAGANVAAVNYHFGDKARLYQEVFEGLIGEALGKYPPDMGLGPNPTPEERLEAFVRSFLLRVLTVDKAAWLMRLMSREMFEHRPYVPISHGLRIGTAILSYNGWLCFGITGDLATAPDAGIVARGIVDGIDELVSAAR